MLIGLKYILFAIYGCKGSKRNFENENIDLNYDKNCHLKASCFTCDNLENSTASSCNRQETKIGKYEHDLYNIDPTFSSITECYDLSDVPESMIDSCLLETKNINSFDQYSITTEQLDILVMEKLEGDNYCSHTPHVNIIKNATDILTNSFEVGIETEFLTRFEKNSDTALDFEANKSISQLSLKEELKTINFIKQEFEIYINQFISKLIPVTHRGNYLRNIKNIEKACVIFEKYKIDFRTHQTNFKFFNDEEFLKELKIISMKFTKNSIFYRKAYDEFLTAFDSKLFCTSNMVKVCDKLRNLSNDNILIVFYCEFIKLYRYIDDIPELLSLSSLIDEKSLPKIIFITHLINLFAESVSYIKENKEDEIEDYRVFILFLVSKAFDCFYGVNFDIFLVPYYELICDKYHHDLTFILWGYERLRYNITRRINRSEGTSDDIKFLKIIFLTFLYQHLIFIKYYSDNVEEINLFNVYIRKVMKSSSECIACLFIEFFTKFKTFKK